MEYESVIVKGSNGQGGTVRMSFYRCSGCRSLIEHSQTETFIHDEWHERLRRATLLASPFGGILGDRL